MPVGYIEALTTVNEVLDTGGGTIAVATVTYSGGNVVGFVLRSRQLSIIHSANVSSPLVSSGSLVAGVSVVGTGLGLGQLTTPTGTIKAAPNNILVKLVGTNITAGTNVTQSVPVTIQGR